MLKKAKKTGDNILLHMCNINEDHMINDSRDIRHDGQSFLSFWAFFPFDPPNTLKNQNFEKMKKTPGDIIILHLCTRNGVWFLG